MLIFDISSRYFLQSPGAGGVVGPRAGDLQDQQQAGVCHQLVHVQGEQIFLFTFKVSKYFCSHLRWANIVKLFCGRGLINARKAKKIESTFDVQGLDHVSWESLYSSVITSFRERNILKQLSTDELVFQVFCIKQLLK